MLTLRLPPWHAVDNEHLARMRQTIESVLDTRSLRGNRAGNQAILDAIGVRVQFERDEAYCQEALDYHLGLLYAYLGDTDVAADHFNRSGTHPGTGGNQLFSDHLYESLALRRHQDQAKERAIPSILIASMPRSASASLIQTIAAALDIPVMRASCGRFPNFLLVPRWFDSAASGGAVLHDHFGANPFNLKILRGGGIHDLFVRIRDPRAAACSSVNLDRRAHDDDDRAAFEERVVTRYQTAFIPWLEGWIDIATSPEAGLRIEWLRYGASHDEISATARSVVAKLATRYPELEPYAAKVIAPVRANFVIGDDESWRRQISRQGQERMWQATPDAVKDLLALRP
jgi:hypothetical protein